MDTNTCSTPTVPLFYKRAHLTPPPIPTPKNAQKKQKILPLILWTVSLSKTNEFKKSWKRYNVRLEEIHLKEGSSDVFERRSQPEVSLFLYYQFFF